MQLLNLKKKKRYYQGEGNSLKSAQTMGREVDVYTRKLHCCDHYTPSFTIMYISIY